MRQLRQSSLAIALAACATLALLGCSSSDDLGDAGQPAPAIFLTAAPDTCSGAGGGSILFSLADVRVIEGFPSQVPQNRVEVTGTVSGLGMADEVEIVLLPYDGQCPILATGSVTVDGDAFTAVVGYDDNQLFRVALVAHAGTEDDLECSTDTMCLSSAAGAFTAVSAGIEVRLR